MKYNLSLSAPQSDAARSAVRAFLGIATGDLPALAAALAPWTPNASEQENLDRLSGVSDTVAAIRAHYFPGLAADATLPIPSSGRLAVLNTLAGRIGAIAGVSRILTLRVAELQALAAALDLYCRLGIGQIERLHDVLNFFPPMKQSPDSLFREVKALYFPKHHGNGSYGIHNSEVPVEYRIAWDVLQVIEHRVAHDTRPGERSVRHYEPLSASHTPLPLITAVG